MKFKEYEMPDGRKAVFEYDENGVGKITLECMDMLIGLINDRKTENSSEIPNNCEPQTEPLQTCSVNGRPYSECSSCEHFKCTADEPQTDCAWREPCGK